MNEINFRDPVRPVDMEIVERLELLDNHVYPLPGGAFPRRVVQAGIDPRLRHLGLMVTGGGIVKPAELDWVVLYEHLATVRDRGTKKLYVAFRETMDALLLRQNDPVKFPEWLMKHPVKKTELRIFIYQVIRNPKLLPRLDSFNDWLEHVEDDRLHDAIAYFLLKKNVFTEEMFGRQP